MTLNLFLITKGREEFLEPLLDSLNRALSREGISLSVVLNGASNKVISRFKEFEKRQSGKVSLHTLEDNDPRAASVWHIVKEVNSDWIAFPSDDDLLEDSFFKDFHKFEKEFSEFGAVATTLQVIDQSGKKTRELRAPKFDATLSKSISFARGLHECPFLWPGLLIRTKLLPELVPNSRYAFDWWMGLFLILTTKVASSSHVMVNYRVHQRQESFQAPLNRKNLEALNCFMQLFASSTFSNWLASLNENQVNEFLDEIRERPPIYGDYKFSPTLVFSLSSAIRRVNSSEQIESRLISLQSWFFRVLLGENEARCFSVLPPEVLVDSNPNFTISAMPSSCPAIIQLADKFKFGNPRYHIKVFCRHTKRHLRKDSLRFNCANLEKDSTNLDKVIVELQTLIELTGLDLPSITLTEFKMIQMTRKIKVIFPAKILRRLKGFMSKSQSYKY